MHARAAGHLVLVGLMGAGKTSVGRICAERLGLPFVDTDALVERHAGRTVAQIFTAEGEAGFRALERQAVAEAVRSPEPVVIACGGGTVLDPENRARLKDRGLVVWLDAPPAALAARTGEGDDRPLLAGPDLTGGIETVLASLADDRRLAYEDAADVVVETGDLEAEQVVGRVIDAYAAHQRGRRA